MGVWGARRHVETRTNAHARTNEVDGLLLNLYHDTMITSTQRNLLVNFQNAICVNAVHSPLKELDLHAFVLAGKRAGQPRDVAVAVVLALAAYCSAKPNQKSLKNYQYRCLGLVPVNLVLYPKPHSNR